MNAICFKKEGINRMFLRVALLILVIFGCASQTGFSDDGAFHRRQIQKYLRAVNSGDEKQIQSAWKEIVSNKETIAYLKSHQPDNLFKIQAQSLLNRVEGIQKEYEEALVSLPKLPQAKFKPASFPFEQPLRPTKTNGEIALERAQIPLVDNQVYALNYPNQNRRPNQEIIQRRFDRLYQQIQERF